jgi:hypothetical protein
LAREHQQDDEAGGDTRPSNVSAKSADGTEELEESAHPAIREGCAAVNRLKR